MAELPDPEPPSLAPAADPALLPSQRLAWVVVVACVLAAVAAMVLVYWPGLQMAAPTIAPAVPAAQ